VIAGPRFELHFAQSASWPCWARVGGSVGSVAGAPGSTGELTTGAPIDASGNESRQTVAHSAEAFFRACGDVLRGRSENLARLHFEPARERGELPCIQSIIHSDPASHRSMDPIILRRTTTARGAKTSLTIGCV